MMNERLAPPAFVARMLLPAAVALSAFVVIAPAQAQDAPDALIKQVSGEVIDTIKADASMQGGDVKKIIALVDQKVMPHVNFQRMTASAVGPAWRSATPEQRESLQKEFKTLLVRTYAGAIKQVSDQTVEIKSMRGAPTDKQVVVQSVVKGRGDPIQLDYRLENDGGKWMIYDVNVLGVWLVDQYRSSFAREINANGIDGLIASLAQKNKAVEG